MNEDYLELRLGRTVNQKLSQCLGYIAENQHIILTVAIVTNSLGQGAFDNLKRRSRMYSPFMEPEAFLPCSK
jgi:hypothetical protein